MKSKIVQLAITIVFTILVCSGALAGKWAHTPQPAQDETADSSGKKGEADEQAPEDVGENETSDQEAESLLAMVMPEAYRSAQDLNVPAGTFISILMREDASAFSADFENGVRRAADDINELLGYTGKDKVRVTCSAPAKSESISGQSAILDEELALYPDVVAASIVDANACEVQFDLAMENGIYIVGFDASPGYDRVAATVETDNAGAARDAADSLMHAMKENDEKGSVLIFAHDSTSMNLKTRVRTFRRRLKKKYPGTKTAGICYMTELDDLRAEAQQYYAQDDDPSNDVTEEDLSESDLIRYIFEIHPKVKGIFAADESTAVKVLEVIEKEQIRLDMTAFGDDRALAGYADRGSLYRFIDENGYGMGYATTIACLRIAAGKGNADRIESGYTLKPEE